MPKLPLSFFLGSYFAAIAANAGILLAVVRFGASPSLLRWLFAPAVYLIVVLCVLVYRAWDSIQDGFARTTPGKAVGLLFIPVFNAYWIFEAFWGFAKDYNRLVSRYRLELDALPEWLFLVYCVLTVLTFFPWVRQWTEFWAGTAALFVAAILIATTCDAVNALPDLRGLRDRRT